MSLAQKYKTVSKKEIINEESELVDNKDLSKFVQKFRDAMLGLINNESLIIKYLNTKTSASEDSFNTAMKYARKADNIFAKLL